MGWGSPEPFLGAQLPVGQQDADSALSGTKHNVEEAWGGDCPCFCGTDRGLHPPEGCDEPEHHSSSGKAGPCAGAGRVPLPWPSVWQLLIGMDSAAVAGAQLQGTDRGQP